MLNYIFKMLLIVLKPLYFQTGHSASRDHEADWHHILRKTKHLVHSTWSCTALFPLSLTCSLRLSRLQNSSSCHCDQNANTREKDRNHLSPCQPNSGRDPHLQLFPDNQWEGSNPANIIPLKSQLTDTLAEFFESWLLFVSFIYSVCCFWY